MNAEKTKYVFMSHECNAAKNFKIKIGNLSLEMTEQFKYLGTILAIENCIHKEIKR